MEVAAVGSHTLPAVLYDGPWTQASAMPISLTPEAWNASKHLNEGVNMRLPEVPEYQTAALCPWGNPFLLSLAAFSRHG